MTLAPTAPAQIETTSAPITVDQEPEPTVDTLRELIGWKQRLVSIQRQSIDRTISPITKSELNILVEKNERLCKESERFASGVYDETSINAALDLAEFYSILEEKFIEISETPQEFNDHKRKSKIARAAMKFVHLVSPRPKPVLDQK